MEPNTNPPADLDSQLSNALRRSRRIIWLILGGLVGTMLLLVAAVAWLVVVTDGNTAQNTRQIEANQAASDHRWCATIDLLTKTPIPKPANGTATPGREATYLLYIDFVQLRTEFRCQQPG